ncbi:hypothetical protein E2C01_101672 [Portunus trituberculatus]|uniref:Uncharacterized protein n=1 Tax=Portunus trituberculatus TaxID=210409 RepID=A0A5B7KFH4_PORTR|nr:hypothetical protein [Portunus trituberculatus]
MKREGFQLKQEALRMFNKCSVNTVKHSAANQSACLPPYLSPSPSANQQPAPTRPKPPATRQPPCQRRATRRRWSEGEKRGERSKGRGYMVE